MAVTDSKVATRNDDQGYYAEGFVASIAAAAGLDVRWPRRGHRTDFDVFRPGPNGTSGSKQISLQIKSWSTGQVASDNHFHYPLEVAAYNYLAGNNHDVRHYLVLCIVPRDPHQYAEASHKELQLRHAAYWLSLRDENPDQSLVPHSSKTVHVPVSQMLTPETIVALIEGNESLAIAT